MFLKIKYSEVGLYELRQNKKPKEKQRQGVAKILVI